MQLVIHERKVRRMALFGKWASYAGIAILAGGLVISIVMREKPWAQGAAWTTLLVGFIVSNIGSYHFSKWGTKIRVEHLIAKHLKGLDDRYFLFSYIAPAEHVLLTPQGLLVLTVRRQRGRIINDGERWRHSRSFGDWLRNFGRPSLGNPAKDIQAEMKAMRNFLAKRLPKTQVPVEGVVVFTHPRAQLELNKPTVPVVHIESLKDYLRASLTGRPIPRRLQRDLAKVFQEEIKQ